MYIYSSLAACSVLDDEFKLVEQLPYDALAHEPLAKGELTAQEQQLLKKHPGAAIIGIKNADVAQTSNVKKLHSVPFDRETMRQALISLTKSQIEASVTDDLLIIQASAHIDELSRAKNLLIRRLREWYELTAPEISQQLTDNDVFVEQILTRPRDALVPELSMGRKLPDEDMAAILALAHQIQNLTNLQAQQEQYLETLMNRVCPNITAIAGAAIGARLLAIAGSLKRLADFPGSTVQLLGAEKALFRHLRDRKQRPPKFGILHEHPIVMRAQKKSQGKAASMLGDKLAIAARIDYFKGEFAGDFLRKQVEKRFGK